MFSFSYALRKLEPSCEIGSVCAAIFRKAPEIKWPLLALSSSPYLLLCNKLSQKNNKRTKPR